MHHISHIVPNSGSVDLENLKISIVAKSDTFQPSHTYTITTTNKHTQSKIQLLDVKYTNPFTLGASFPKLVETGMYKFDICDNQAQHSKKIHPENVKPLSSIVESNLARIISNSMLELVTVNNEAEVAISDSDEQTPNSICCDVEFTCYPIIHDNATKFIVSSYEGGEILNIYGVGFSHNSKLVMQDNEIETQVLSDKHLSAILPKYDGIKEGRIGVKSNDAIAFSNLIVKYRLPEILELSTNNVYIHDNTSIMIYGDFFGKPENADKMGVYLNDIHCVNVTVISDKQISFTLPPALLCANVYNCMVGVKEYRSNERYVEITPFLEKLSESSVTLAELSSVEIKIYGQGFDEENDVFFGRIKCSHVKREERVLIVKIPEDIQYTGSYPVSVKVNEIISNKLDFKIANHKIVSVEEIDSILYIYGNGLDGEIILCIGSKKIPLNNHVENVIVLEYSSREVFGCVDIYVEKNDIESVKIKHIISAKLQNRDNLIVSTGSKNEKLTLKYLGKYNGNKLQIVFDLPSKDERSDSKRMKISKCENVFENGVTTIAFYMPEVEYPHSDIEGVLYIDNVRFDEIMFHYLPKIELVYQNIVPWNKQCLVEIIGDNIPSTGKIVVDDSSNKFTIENEGKAMITIPPFQMAGKKSIGIVFDRYPSSHFPAIVYVLPHVDNTSFSARDTIAIRGRGFCKNINYRAMMHDEEIECRVTSESECKITASQFSHETENHVKVFANEHLFFDSVVHYPEILTHIIPNYGICSHAQQVVLYGNGFSKKTIVVFGGKTIDDIEYISNVQIKIKLPECAEHMIHSVYTINDEKHNSANTLVYTSIPELTRLSPGGGSCLGKNEITIYGKGFAAMETVKMIWDGKTIEYSVVDVNSLLVKVPPKHINAAIKVMLQTEEGVETNALDYEYLPHLEKLSEYNGYMIGGKTIIVYGYCFTKNMKVLWNNTCIDSKLISESELSIVIPKSDRTKTIDVGVEYNNHKSKQVLKYSYIPHTISNIYPNEGSIKGNYEVTIHGDGLFSDEDVYVVVGASVIQKKDFVFYDKNAIRFIIPESDSAGKNTVDVIINNGKADKSLDFEYNSRITSLSQNGITVNTKTPLTIFGEGFSGCSIVKMGTHTIQNINYHAKDGSIHFVTPIIECMQKITVSVTTNNIVSNEVVVYVKPIIKNILPNPWTAEDNGFLYVSGEGFQDTVVACIMGLKSPSIINPLRVTTTNATFVLPYIKQCGEIIIAIGLLDMAENMWIVHKIHVQPKITRLSESAGPVIGNNKIEIIGKGFHPRCKIQVCDTTTFFQPSRIEFVSENLIVVTMPASEQVEKIRIMLWCNEIPSNKVEYNYCPYIKDIRPNYSSINGGVVVVVDGEGFNADSIVRLNKIQIAKEDTTFDSTTRNLRVIIPKHFEVENMALKVVSNDCDSINTIKFFYTPFLDSLSITSTSVTKQEIIKLYGNGFSKNTSVKIGDKMANKKNIVKIFDNVMEIKLPVIDEQCLLDIRVITNGIPTAQTKSIAVAAEFSHIEPTEGPIKGGTAIQVYGNGFNNEMTIFFNDVKILYKLISSHQLKIISPTDNIVLGNNNKIHIINNNFSTNLIANFSCYPSIVNIMQKYDAVNKKMTIWIQGSGFSTNAQILIGKKTGLIAIAEKNTLKTVFEESLRSNNEMSEVYVVAGDLTSYDKIFYSTVPIVTKISNSCGIIAGDNQIIIYGAGFDKEQTYVSWNKSMKIKPVMISANCLKFMTPRHNTSEKIIFCVISNEIESAPMEFMYCPEITSVSEKSCNIGEEHLCKVYGEGFEYENSEIFIKNHGKCKVKEYINNKIIDIVCSPFKQCGIYDMYAETSGISSQNSIKIEVKPMILKICSDVGNVNGGKIVMNVIGVNTNSSILFCYKNHQIEFHHILLLDKMSKKSSDIEQITLCYDAIAEFKNTLVDEKKEIMNVQVKIKTNEIESMPILWCMKNLEANPDIDHEIIKAITICSNYLSSNEFNKKYQLITPHTDKFAFKISEMIAEIYALPETIFDSGCKQILLNGFMSMYDKNEQVSDELVQNIIIHMIHSLINKLCFGNDYDAVALQIHKPLLINAVESVSQKGGEFDYFFQEKMDLNESSWLIHAQELSQAICFKIVCDGSIEFKYNQMLLDAICDQFEKKMFERKFALTNTDARFNGTSVRSPSGNIIELFSCKVTSALENMPQTHATCIDMDCVTQEIIEGKQYDGSYNSLAKQLKTLLLNREIITNIYNHYQKNTFRMANMNSTDDYTPLPFHRGDTLLFKILIRKTISAKEVVAIRELTQYKLARDPNSQNRNSAYDFLLKNDSTEIRETNDCYEIIMG